MQLSDALSQVSFNSRTEFQNLTEILSPEIIQKGLENSGVATIRKRKLPMESMVWAVIGMALFRKFPMRQLVNQLDILLPNSTPYIASSAVTQARQKLGSESIRSVFNKLNASGMKKHSIRVGVILIYMVWMVLSGELPTHLKIVKLLNELATIMARPVTQIKGSKNQGQISQGVRSLEPLEIAN